MTMQLDRRAFFGLGVGLTLTFALANTNSAVAGAAPNLPLNLWVSIGTDNTVTIVSPAAEMGQGTFTSLPLILAEELDADWGQVRIIEPSDWDTRYGNSLYGMTLMTAGSCTVQGYFLPLRIAGAQARRVLLESAAVHWQLPVDELSTVPNRVVHRLSGKSLSYGTLAAFTVVPSTLPVIVERDLKPTSFFRLIGKDVPRVDVPLKVRGAAKYGMDMHLPGMLYAALLQPPYPGGAAVSVDDAKARAVAGIVRVVTIPEGVGVLGTTVEATRLAKTLLNVTWSDAPGARYDSETALDDFAAMARDRTMPGIEFLKKGDVDVAFAGVEKRMYGEYRTRHIYHGQMEPLTATASVSADGRSVEIWSGVQAITRGRLQVAAALNTTPDRVQIHQLLVGGSYGRRSSNEVIVQAARLAQAAKAPVKLIWSREDDLQFGRFRPATAHFIEAGFDTEGNLVAWHHRVVADSVINFLTDGAVGTKIADAIVMKGSQLPSYGIPNKFVEQVIEQRGARISPYRGVGNGTNSFAVESFIDEIAHSKGQDPLAFRATLAAGSPRALALFRAIATMSKWSQPRTARSLGVGFSEKDGTLNAGVIELSVDRTRGKIEIHNVWVAIDAGIAVQPRNIKAQLEGGMVFALGLVLREQVDIKQGIVQQSNFFEYKVPRMSDVPNIEIQVLSTDNPPTGVGEDGVPIMAAASRMHSSR